jgi:hypothetical protein
MKRSSVASHLRVEVKHRRAAPKRYTWEILSEGKTLPVEESTDQFRSWEEASQAGKTALEEIISKSCRTPTKGKRVHLIDLRRDTRENRACKASFSHHLTGSNPNHGETCMAGANPSIQ